MKTDVLKKLKGDLTLPVIVAPMFIVSKTEMVLASMRAGVIGTFPTLNARTNAELEEWFEHITQTVDEENKGNEGRKLAPWGVNLIVHHTNPRYEEDLASIKKYKVPLVITSLGKPVKEVEVVHEYGGAVFSDVISITHAKKAIEAGVDGLILVCNGAGGHGGTLNPFAFVAEVRQFFDGVIILSGTISNGQEIAAAQMLGADFAYMGTRFIATEEANAVEAYKEMLIQSTAHDILYTDALSGVRANYLIPSIERAGYDPNHLEKTGEIKVVHAANEKESKAWKDIWSAGQGVGSIKDVKPVAELVETLRNEYAQAITKMNEQSAILVK